jgi:hypothetical protein
MNDDSRICVICGEYLDIEGDTVVVEVLPSSEGTIQRVVHKECIENIRKSF